MDDQDAWRVFDGLSDAEQGRVYEAVRDRRMGSRVQTRHTSDQEISDLHDLMTLLEQERRRRELAPLLAEFLPDKT